MNDHKKVVVTIWIVTIVLLALFALLPTKADQFFLSSRIFITEQKNIEQQNLQKKNILQLLRSPNDDQQLLKMLQERAREDGKGLMILFGIIFIVFNIMACLLYIFGMKPPRIVLFVLGFLIIPIVLVVHSYIRISP
jgi:hypothetical protein